jgi:phosphoribosyl 1,2-cyclic phosphodiesterase
MAVSVTVLGSGSRGNCTVLASSRTTLLIDAGFSCREITNRMRAAELDPESLDGVIISHEHSDHVSAVDVLARRMKLPVYMTDGTYQGWRQYMRRANGGSNRCDLERRERFRPGTGFSIGDIDIMPFTIPHDAEDPVGFTFRAEGIKLAVVTDLGYLPRSVIEHLRGCDLLMIESNHDLEMLRVGPYPWAVKQRVMSRVGHLSNEALAEFFTSDYDGAASYLVLAHLSEQNNHPEIARQQAHRALAGRGDRALGRLLLASQTEVLESIRL